jgi:hypothetical protein
LATKKRLETLIYSSETSETSGESKLPGEAA